MTVLEAAPDPTMLGWNGKRNAAPTRSVVLPKDLDLKGPFSAESFFAIKKTDINLDYTIGKKLGEGSYGEVKLAIHKKSLLKRAMKIIKINSIPEMEKQSLLQEVEILKSLDHPNIIKIFDLYEDSKNYYLITEYCSGGELFDRIQKNAVFTEREAARYIKQLLSALTYLHDKNIVHRDLKAENLLFENNSAESHLKLIDFGVSSEFLKGKKLKETLGTPYYIAPEVLLQSYDEKCDVWSCGVILYILLCGYPPFNGDNDKEIMQAVKGCDLKFYGTFPVTKTRTGSTSQRRPRMCSRRCSCSIRRKESLPRKLSNIPGSLTIQKSRYFLNTSLRDCQLSKYLLLY